MSHPEELLAGYVEGALEQHERAMVEAHLVACDLCTEEIGLAGRARDALAALPEETVPLGVTGPVLAELQRDVAGAPDRQRLDLGAQVGDGHARAA